MKLSEVQVGGRYTAKVSGVITTVRVLAIRNGEALAWNRYLRRMEPRHATRIDVVNERTGRKTTFRSAARLRRAMSGTTPPALPTSVPQAPPTLPHAAA